MKFDLFTQTVGVGQTNSSPLRRQINLTNFRLPTCTELCRIRSI